MPGLRDRVDILWPATKVDPYTEESKPDWSQPLAKVDPVRAEVQPVSSTERAVTSETIVSRWACWLDPTTEVDSVCRVRWDGVDYLIDGEVERWKTGTRVRRQYLTLKRVK